MAVDNCILTNNLGKVDMNHIVRYGDIIMDGDGETYAIVQTEGGIYKVIHIESFNRKRDSIPNIYGKTVEFVLQYFSPRATYVKYDDYKITASSKIQNSERMF